MTSPSRRQFVAALLGVPAMLSGCRESRRGLPDGELLLPAKRAGHRLRDALSGREALPPIEPSVDLGSAESVEVAVVGAGVSGLAAAWWLRRAGVRDLVVLEADDALGGTARAGGGALTDYPWGAHYVVAPSPRHAPFELLARELGALEPAGAGSGGALEVAEHHACREPEERVYHAGRWYPGLYLHAGASPDDLAQLARFRAEVDRWVRFRDAAGRRAFDLPTSLASDAAEVRALDRVSFADWLDRLELRSSRLRWLTDYACRDDYGLLERDASAWAGLMYFASRLEAPGAESRPVLTWPEGNARLTAKMAEGLGARLRLEHAVWDVEQRAEGVRLRVLGPDGPRALVARHVVVSTPLMVARRIVKAWREGARQAVAVDRGAWAVANLHLSGRPGARAEDAPLSWDNVLRSSPSLGYVVATHQSGRDHGPTVLSWYYPFTGDGREARQKLDGASRADWAQVALADLARAHPDVAELCERIDVAYWGHGMVRPRPGSAFDEALRRAREPLGRVHFAVSELSGVSLFEEALDHGVRAAREVLAERARGA